MMTGTEKATTTVPKPRYGQASRPRTHYTTARALRFLAKDPGILQHGQVRHFRTGSPVELAFRVGLPDPADAVDEQGVLGSHAVDCPAKLGESVAGAHHGMPSNPKLALGCVAKVILAK